MFSAQNPLRMTSFAPSDIEASFDARAATYNGNEWHRQCAERLVSLGGIRQGHVVRLGVQCRFAGARSSSGDWAGSACKDAGGVRGGHAARGAVEPWWDVQGRRVVRDRAAITHKRRTARQRGIIVAVS